MTVHSLSPYKDYNICVRQIDDTIFEYLITKGDIYSDYFIINPKTGCKTLTPEEIKEACAMIGLGAVTTIDSLMELERIKTIESQENKPEQ